MSMSLPHALTADLYTLTRSRTVRWVSLGAVVLGALLTGALAMTHGTADQLADLGTAYGQGEVLIDPITSLVIAALAAAFWGAAYRDGSILWAYLAGSSRVVVGISALVTSALLGLVVSALVVATKVVTLLATNPTDAGFLAWGDTHGRVAIGGALLSGVVMAVVSTAASLILRSAALAIATVLGWMLVIEPLLVGLLPRDTWTWLPAHALTAIRNAVPDVDLTRALLMVLAYTAVAVGAALLAVTRRDPA